MTFDRSKLLKLLLTEHRLHRLTSPLTPWALDTEYVGLLDPNLCRFETHPDTSFQTLAMYEYM